VAVSLATRGAFLGVEILDLDEAAHAVGSWELLRGRLLYTEFADHKPPLLYVYYALAQLLLGRGLWAVRVLTVLVTVPLTAYGVSACFRHDRHGRIAGFTFLIASASFLAHDMHSVNAELLFLLPATWALVLLRDEAAATHPFRCASAGALLGLAVLFKYQAALWLPAAAFALLLAKPAWRGAAAAFRVVVGGALPPLLAYLVFVALGGEAGFLYWNVGHNLAYAANPIPLSEALQRASSYLLPFVVVTAPLWIGWRRSQRSSPSFHLWRLASLVLAASFISAVLGLRFYPHYFVPLYVPLAIGAAPWVAEQLRRPLRRTGRILVGWAAVAFLGFTGANAWLYFDHANVYEETDPAFRRVAERLRADECFERASLFVWGFAPMLYYYADRPVASRFVMPQASLTGYVPGNPASRSSELATDSLIRPEHWDWLLADLESNHPTYILDTSPSGLHGWDRYPLRSYPRLLDLVRRAYEPLDSVDDVHIYRRRGCAAGARRR
jgi:4-amino-4-deoxy-L-arabinose transferase-like glycosyltransferase